MAIRGPLRVKDTTSTTGTGPYTYNRAVLTGYRSIADAIADGSLANGDQVYYEVVDTTAAGSGNLLEAGLGTINSVAFTLTRDTILQSSNAGGAVSWGAGTRDLLIVTIYEALALLAKSNTFTALQKILVSGTIITPAAETALVVQASAAAGTNCGASIVSGSTGISILNLGNSASEQAGGVKYNSSTNALTFRTGATDRAAIDSTGVLKTAAGALYDAFPSTTTKAPFFMAAAPTGWVQDATHNDKVLRVVSTAGGGTGGSWTISGLSSTGGITGAHTLVTAEIPAHTHTIVYETAMPLTGGGTVSPVEVIGTGGQSANTGSTGGGGGHDHTLPAIASTGAWRPAYIDCIVCTKS